MTDLQLLDSRLIEAFNEGDLVLVGVVVGLLMVGAIAGLISWLKGRRFAAVVVWVLLIASVAAALLPISIIESVVDADRATLSWGVVGVTGAALLIGAVAALRLARPPSWWAQRRYDNDRYARAIERHHWTRPQAR